jgi:hypothetical protein
MYGMSERTFYYLVERAKNGSRAEDLKDRPSKPKNPYRKLTDEDKAEIINLCLDDTNRIESSRGNPNIRATSRKKSLRT